MNAYMLGEKYNRPTIDIFNEKNIEAAALLEKTEAYTNKVGYSKRTSVVIEPKLSMQWFLKMEHFAEMALVPVMNDELR